VFLVGLEREDLAALRRRSRADDALEIVGEALLRDVRRDAVRLSDSIDAVVMSPAVWDQSPLVAPRWRPEASTDDRLVEELTARERDVLALVADGHSNREIAARLDISEHTVKFHLASIFGKLGVSTRTQAVRRALEWGLIEI
jgi:DNA-binding CsgD family transcriptional regulator